MKQYEGALRCVQVMPLDEEGIPLHEIYGSMLVEEDLTAVKKTRRPDEPSGKKALDCVKDMFYVEDKLAKRIILLGEAGHGKTVFCLQILESWSKAKTPFGGAEGENSSTSVEIKHADEQGDEGSRGCRSARRNGSRLSLTRESRASDLQRGNPDLLTLVHHKDEYKALQSCLSFFDLVFFVPLRHAKQGTSFIVDLVCDSIEECDKNTELNIKQMLRDGNLKCLIILDGLDEWRAPDTCRVEGFPDSDGLVNCTLFCTMRPWRMINLRLGLSRTFDKVVEILGLKEESIETVISNVLVNFYGLEITSDLYKEKFSRFCKNARFPEMNSLMKIPLILTVSCLVWNEDDDISNDSEIYQATSSFMTFFYLKLMEITITRAENKHAIVRSFLVEKRQKPEMSFSVPSIILGFEPIIDFIEILKPVGRLALQDLLSQEPHLVFPRNKLEREIGQSKVEIAMKAGILGQTKAPGFSHQQRVSVSFYHKTIQEFSAALHMTCGDSEALRLFRTHCNTVDKVMELSNMIIFVCGLDPMVGCQLSKHVKDVINSDADIIMNRESMNISNKVGELYTIQCKWFREMKQNLSYTHNTNRTPTLHVTDVRLCRYSYRDGVSEASELVCMEDNSIVSVYLDDVRHPVHSIIQHLPVCKHFTTLHIWNLTDTQDRALLAEVLPQLVHVQCVVYCYDIKHHRDSSPSADMPVVRALQQLPALRCIELSDITLTDTITLPLQLETVKLWYVEHANFLLPSLCQCIQLKCIELGAITLTDTVTLPSQLETVKLWDVYPAHFILPSLCQCIQLTCLKLNSITLTDTVSLPPKIQKVKLHDVYPAYFILSSLPGCPHLTSLHIIWLYTMEDCEMLASVLSQLPQLQYIHYDGVNTHCGPAGHAAVVSALQHLKQVRHIKLEDIDLGDDGTLLVTPHMTQLQKVGLTGIKMSARRWAEFVSSLISVQHKVYITLERTDIDDAAVKTITSSPNFTWNHVLEHPSNIIPWKNIRRIDIKFHTNH